MKGTEMRTMLLEYDYNSFYVIQDLMENSNNNNLFLHIFHNIILISPVL